MTDKDVEVRTKLSPLHYRAFWLAPAIPCLVLGYVMGSGVVSMVISFYAFIFSYALTWGIAYPVFRALIRKKKEVTFLQCLISGVLIGWVLPVFLSLITLHFQAWFSEIYPPHFAYDLISGGIFGGSIGGLFGALICDKSKKENIFWLICFLITVISLPYTFLPLIETTWNIFLKPVPPSLETVTPKNFSFDNYGAEHARGAVLPNSEQAKALKKALDKIFPVGTSRSYIEEIISKRRGRQPLVTLGDDRSNPSYIMPIASLFPLDDGCKYSNWLITIQYNADNQLQKLELSTKDSCGKVVKF